jgi:hypothetical protein
MFLNNFTAISFVDEILLFSLNGVLVIFAAHGIKYASLNMQEGFVQLYVTDTVLDNDCCVQTLKKNCPPGVYICSKNLGVTSKF